MIKKLGETLTKEEFLWLVIRSMFQDDRYLIDVLLNEYQSEFKIFYGIEQEHIDEYYDSKTPPLDEEKYKEWIVRIRAGLASQRTLDQAENKCRQECEDLIDERVKMAAGLADRAGS